MEFSERTSIFYARRKHEILHIHISEPLSQQRSRPTSRTLGRWLIRRRQDAFARLRRVLRLSAPIARLIETREPLSRHSAHATSIPCRSYSQPCVQSLGSPCPPPGRTMRDRCRSRCSVFVERAKPSSSARSSVVRIIGLASGMPLMHPCIITHLSAIVGT